MSVIQGVAGNPVVPMTEFVNNKLTAKANRQMQGSDCHNTVVKAERLGIHGADEGQPARNSCLPFAWFALHTSCTSQGWASGCPSLHACVCLV